MAMPILGLKETCGSRIPRCYSKKVNIVLDLGRLVVFGTVLKKKTLVLRANNFLLLLFFASKHVHAFFKRQRRFKKELHFKSTKSYSKLSVNCQ